MKLPKIALQQGADSDDVASLIREVAASRAYDTLGVAVAYASVPGVRKLLETIGEDRLPVRSQWLFGLDDLVTHPDAIKLVKNRLAGAEVRVAGQRVNGKKFHPKMYWFSKASKPGHSSLVLGSANLSLGGLSGNVEAVVALAALVSADSEALNAVWEKAWAVGLPSTEQLLADYERDFRKAEKARKKSAVRPLKNQPVLASDAASRDPSLAKSCWIEVGNITGFQQEQLEIKAEQAMFFGLPQGGGNSKNIRVVTSGQNVDIPVNFYGNHMWRLNLPQSIPEVAKGLRPGGGMSPFVAVFERAGNYILLHFIKVKSHKFISLRNETMNAGTLGRTTAREYGWV